MAGPGARQDVLEVFVSLRGGPAGRQRHQLGPRQPGRPVVGTTSLLHFVERRLGVSAAPRQCVGTRDFSWSGARATIPLAPGDKLVGPALLLRRLGFRHPADQALHGLADGPGCHLLPAEIASFFFADRALILLGLVGVLLAVDSLHQPVEVASFPHLEAPLQLCVTVLARRDLAEQESASVLGQEVPAGAFLQTAFQGLCPACRVP